MSMTRAARVVLALTPPMIAACGASTPTESAAPSSAPSAVAAAPSASAPSIRRKAAQTERDRVDDLIARGEFDASDLEEGTGKLSENGSRLTVRYVGKLADGTVFDETGRRPFEFTLGEGSVLAGWDRGLVHMKVGGKRRLILPPDLAYGARGAPPKIPPNATLVFEVELLDVQP